MKTQLSISEMVAKARESGMMYNPPKRRRDRATREAEMRTLRIIMSRNTEDDSDFDDSFISDVIWDKMFKYEDKEYDQLIFNIFRQVKFPNQERKVNVTIAASVRDCPEKADEIALCSTVVTPVLSQAPQKRKMSDIKTPKSDVKLNQALPGFVEGIKQSSIEDFRSKKKET